MGRLTERFLAPAPPERLAVLRILVGTYAVAWSLVRLPAHLSHIDQPGARWQPIGVLSPFSEPLPDAAIIALAIGTPLLGLLYVAGWRFAVSGPAFAVALLAVATLDSSWGQIFHTENLMVLHVGIVALVPAAAHALAVGNSAGARSPADLTSDGASRAAPHGRYGWPVRLAAIVVVLAYVIAGLAKLQVEGPGWAGGDVLRNLVAYDNLRKDLLGDVYSPLGAHAVGFPGLFPPLATASLAIELGAWVALVGGRWRTVWVLAAWVFHVGVLVLMAILFPYQLSGVAFAPFFRIERLASVRRRSLPLPTG